MFRLHAIGGIGAKTVRSTTGWGASDGAEMGAETEQWETMGVNVGLSSLSIVILPLNKIKLISLTIYL